MKRRAKEGMETKKADEWEWFIEDNNTLVLSRVKKKPKRKFLNIPLG
jgi:hypothetical protein